MTLSVTQLARAADVGVETVRHYEAIGLLPRPPRTGSGYRAFAPDSVRRMAFIRRAKALGFQLPEIKELLALSDGRDRDMRSLRSRAAAKLDDIDARIRELKRVRKGLAALVDACPGHGPLKECPILSALADSTEKVL